MSSQPPERSALPPPASTGGANESRSHTPLKWRAQMFSLQRPVSARSNPWRTATSVLSALVALALVSTPSMADEFFSYTIGAPGNSTEVAIKGDMSTTAVQPGGTYHYSIPIEVPSGPRGTAPQLSIVYTGTADGWLGKGWSLSLSSITRDTREGVPQEPALFTGGSFMLDGKPLIRESAGSNRYRTELESHQRITYDAESRSWRAENPDGSVATYSEHVYAKRIDGTTIQNAQSVKAIREWLLKSVADTAGNTITYNYETLPAGKQTTKYAKSIVWGNPDGRRSVCFVTELRSALAPPVPMRESYNSGSRAVEDGLLTRIDVLFNPGSNGCSGGSMVRSYVLTRGAGPSTEAPRLIAVDEIGYDETVPPSAARSTTFTYTDENAPLIGLSSDNSFLDGLPFPSENASLGGSEANEDVLFSIESVKDKYNDRPPHGIVQRGQYKGNFAFADLNGDGVPEYIRGIGGPYGGNLSLPESVVWTRPKSAALWKDDSAAGGSGMHIPVGIRELGGGGIDRGARFLDLNRDGAQDILVSFEAESGIGPISANESYKNLNRGTAWAQGAGLPAGLRFSYYNQDTGVRIADVNGDGYPDIVFGFAPPADFLDPTPPDPNTPRYYTYWRDISANDSLATNEAGFQKPECYWSEYPEPIKGSAVYLNNRQGGWTLASYGLPAGVYFVGPVPADEGDWRCPEGTLMTSTSGSSFDAAVDSDLGTLLIDVNGDGLPDIVKGTQYFFDCGATECTEYFGASEQHNGVFINTGNGWKRSVGPGSWTEAFQAAGVKLHATSRMCKDCPVDTMLVDINDDGLPDILKRDPGSCQTAPAPPDAYTIKCNYWYLLNTGSGWKSSGGPHPVFAALSFHQGQVFEDFNGDGRPDYFSAFRFEQNWPSSHTNLHYVDFLKSPSTHPDRLATVTNWLGGKSTITYGHSSQWQSSHGGNLPQVRTVVTKVEADPDPSSPGNELRPRSPWNGQKIVPSSTYEYRQGKFDFARREFLGFGLVTSSTLDGTDSAGSVVVTDTHYDQRPAYKGLVTKTVVKSSPNNQHARQVKEFGYTVVEPVPGKVFDRRLDWETERETLAGPVLKRVDYLEYDTHGNLLRRIEGGTGSGARACPSCVVAGARRETLWTYAKEISDLKWLVKLPASMKTCIAGTQDCATTLYGYDGGPSGSAPTRGLLTSLTSLNTWAGVAEEVVTRKTYTSERGVLESETDANGNVTTFTHDASQSFITAITNALGHTTTFHWHGINPAADPRDASEPKIPGTLQKVVEPNGQGLPPGEGDSLYVYDRLARLRKLFRPGDGTVAGTVYRYVDFLNEGNVGQQRIGIDSRSDASGDGYFTTVHVLDGFGRIAQTRSELPDPASALVTTRYFDPRGRTWKASVPMKQSISGANLGYQPVPESATWTETRYDRLGRVDKEINTDTSFRQYSYDGLKVTVRDERDHFKTLDYDSHGRLWQVAERVGLGESGPTYLTQYEYNVLDNLRRILRFGTSTPPFETPPAVEPSGHLARILYVYDRLGRRRTMLHPDRGTWRYAYDPGGNLIEQQDAKETVLRFEYDALGRLVHKYSPDALLARFFYDNEKPSNSGGGLADQLAWHDWGANAANSSGILPAWSGGAAANNFTTDTDSSSVQASVVQPYSASLDHFITGVTEPLSFTVSFHDAPGLNMRLRLYAGNELLETISGNLASGTGHTVTREVFLDLASYPAATKLSLAVYYGEAKIYSTALVKAAGQQPFASTDLTNNRLYTVEGGIGRMGAGSVFRAPGLFETAHVYGPDGVQHIVQANVNEPLTLNLKYVDLPGLSMRVELRDESGTQTFWTSPSFGGGGTAQEVQHHVAVDLAQWSSAARVVLKVLQGRLELLHSSLSRPRSSARAPFVALDESQEGRQLGFVVANGIGRMTAYLDASGQTELSYDVQGRVLAEHKVLRQGTELHGYVTEHTYTPDGLPLTMTYPNDEVVTYAYDPARRLAGLSSFEPSTGKTLGLIHQAAYGPLNPQSGQADYGLLSKLVFSKDAEHPAGRYTTTYHHRLPGTVLEGDEDFRLWKIQSQELGAEMLMQDLTYTYDKTGNVLSIGDPLDSGTEGNAGGTFGYDGLGRLTGATINNSDLPAGSETLSFQYDALGNMTWMESWDQKYGSGCDLGHKPHQVCESGPATKLSRYTYDANGNLLSSTLNDVPDFSGTYDAENRLTEAERTQPTGSSGHLSLVYDAMGTRVQRTLASGTTYYIGPHYEKRSATGEGKTSLYHAFGRLIAERVNIGEAGETVRFHFTDHLGSSSVTRSTAPGNSARWQTYRPYGWDHVSSNPENQNGYKFTGQEQDFAWLYNYKARSYLPGVGVFTQADTYEGEIYEPQTLNPYAYVTGNPLKYTDPTGHRRGYGVNITVEAYPYGEAPDEKFQRWLLETAQFRRTLSETRSYHDRSVGFFFYGEFGPDGSVTPIGMGIDPPLEGAEPLAAAIGLFQAGSALFKIGHAAVNGIKTTRATLEVFRVEGAINARIVIGANGEVFVSGKQMLFLNFGSKARAEAFLAKRLGQGMSDATIKSFRVPQSFADELSAAAVLESEAAMFPHAPLLVDVTKAARQFGLRAEQIEALKQAIIQGTGRIGQSGGP
jgi:RHS repeat-associated protein